MVENNQKGQLIYDHTGIGIVKDNINTSIGMKKMPVLVLARLAEIKITSTGNMYDCTGIGIVGKRMSVPV